MTADEIQDIARKLASVANIFHPGSATAIGLLLEAGAELTSLVNSVRAQTASNAPDVWAKVQDDFGDAVSAWEHG